MKTPRDLLFARHQSAAPRLDAIRQQVLQASFPAPRAARVSFVQQFWLECFWSCRRIWAGLGAVWILLLVVNLTQRTTTESVAMKASARPEIMTSLLDQKQWLNELLAGRSQPPDAEQPRTYLPKPRTEGGERIIL